MSVAAKQPYMVDDLENLSSYWKVPVHHPDVGFLTIRIWFYHFSIFLRLEFDSFNFQFFLRLKFDSFNFQDVVEVLMNRGSLLPMRFLTVLRRENPFYLEAASREFWMRVWSRDEPIHRLEDIRQVSRSYVMTDYGIGLGSKEDRRSECDRSSYRHDEHRRDQKWIEKDDQWGGRCRGIMMNVDLLVDFRPLEPRGRCWQCRMGRNIDSLAVTVSMCLVISLVNRLRVP